jgi:hypothetical protein
MNLDLTQQFRTLDGKPIMERKDKNSEPTPLILKGILVVTLLGQCHGDETPESSAFRLQRFDLSKKLTAAEDSVTLDLKEMVQLKKSVDTRIPALLPLMHGQAVTMLDGNPTGLEPKTDDEEEDK